MHYVGWECDVCTMKGVAQELCKSSRFHSASPPPPRLVLHKGKCVLDGHVSS